jgi:hypothetical protein
MRIFLCVLLFDIIYRSLSVLLPWSDWISDLDMKKYPRRLATREERERLAAQATADNPNPVLKETMLALDSIWEYWKPWPGPDTRDRMNSRQDRVKFALAWLTSRLDFVENVVGINEEWPMFSPGVSKRKWVARARLIYADGSQRIIRNHGDPEDLTRYSHWFEEKILDHELKVEDDERSIDEAFGYCNLLAHRYSRNDAGKELKTIRLFMVRYDFPPPGADARAFLAAQNGPPKDQVYPDFYEYDVARRHGKFLPKQSRK